MSEDTRQQAGDWVSEAVLKRELEHLREFIALRLDGIEKQGETTAVRVDTVCAKVERIDGRVVVNTHAVDKLVDRTTKLEAFQAGVVSTMLRWGSLGVGAAVTVVAVVLGILRWLGVV